MVKVIIKYSDNPNKKFKAIFYDNWNHKFKTVHFGAKGMSDFTIHRDDERKERYLKRHYKNENWKDYKSAGCLWRYILWNKPTIKESIEDYKKKFNLL